MADPLAGVELPVVQAGMGGGIARHELAAAVSEAGGLGTIGHADVRVLARELAAARALTGRPLAVNLLLPFAGREHWQVAAGASVVVTFWGAPRRRAAGPWLHQCGSVEEALAAHAAGADGVIVQGHEAGGHVRGELPALELLERARAALPAGYPILLAGGIAVGADVRAALAAGARAAVCGTRFVLSDESRAHPGYRSRLIAGRETLVTELFGLGWPAAPHRVLPNRATQRRPHGAAPLTAALNRAATPLVRRLPERLQRGALERQRARLPLLAPAPPTDDGPASLVDSGPLYAGTTVARITDVRPAAAIVAALTSG